MAFLESLEQMRSVLWAKSYLWDCKIIGAPPPFDNWFPAQTVNETLFDISDKELTIGTGAFSIPQSYKEREISLTMYDDNNCTLEKFLVEWKNLMFPTRTSVQVISNVTKQLCIAKLNNQRKITNLVTYDVRPSGKFFFQGNTESAARTYTITFKVCSIVGKSL